MRLRKFIDGALGALTWVCAGLTIGVFVLLLGYILIKGVPNLKPSLFSLTYTSQNVSLLPSLISTIFMTAMSLLIAVPLGLFAAVYLVEYAKRGNKAVLILRVATETLSGIPSIVYGLFGMLFFVTSLGWGLSLASGAVTLSIMVLPLIIRSTEEAILSVPDAYREAAFGLGAGKLRTVMRIVLPAAVPGILAGIILAVGRIVGETAALVYTAGTVARVPTAIDQSVRTLSVHMYALSSEGFHTPEAYATAVVLLVLVVGINSLSAYLSKKLVGR